MMYYTHASPPAQTIESCRPQLVSLSVDAPLPAIQTVSLSNMNGGYFTLRVMADAVGGPIDVTTAAISFDANAATVDTALEAAGGGALGTVQVTETIGTPEHTSPTRLASKICLPASKSFWGELQ